jgi:hypothetical protein
MPEFHVRADSINVEQIMEQIRARISEKRGVDYTEQQIRDLATVKLEKFLDPRGLRSDLLDQFRRARDEAFPPAPPNYEFEDQTLFESHRSMLRWIRRLLRPVLKVFFNPDRLIHALHIQAQINTIHAEREAKREGVRRGLDQLQYEMLHNLVIETTRMSIEVKNLKMRVESLTSRLEFNERRARALESVVAYKPTVDERSPSAAAPDVLPQSVPEDPATGGMPAGSPGPGQRSRRRRRRRGRRGDGSAAAIMTGSSNTPHQSALEPAEPAVDSGAAPEAPAGDSTPYDSDPDRQ